MIDGNEQRSRIANANECGRLDLVGALKQYPNITMRSLGDKVRSRED
jgi:hypothetical protein